MSNTSRDAEEILRSIDLTPWRWRLIRLGVVMVVLLVVVGVVVPRFLRKVGPGEVGVKTVNIAFLGREQGVQQKIYGPGKHLILPGAEVLDTFDVTIQMHNMLRQESASLSPKDDWVRIKTSDGNFVYVDVTVLYQIVRGDAWKIRSEIGLGESFLEKKVRPEARSVIRSVLGELTTEEFYQSEIRQKKVRKAREILDGRLTPNGARVLDVLIRDYEFTDSVENAIGEKKLQDQLVLVNKAEAKAAEELAKRDKVIAEGEASANVERARGLAESQKIAAEANLILAEKKAQGDLAIKIAEAEGRRLTNEALVRAGGANVVALEMAKRLEGIDTLVLSSSGTNPLDVGSMLTMLGVPPQKGGK